ncbi:MAG: ABC transporter substrate-binding protein [bacterium]
MQVNHDLVAEWNAAHPETPVEYVQGTWGSIHDYLITAFETGEVPDVFHYESSIIVDFAVRGYLADLAPMLTPEIKQDVLEVAWASVRRSNGEITGVPFLMESLVVLYNKSHFAAAGIAPPTSDEPWRWEDLRQAAIKLTRDTDNDGITDQWGAAFGLRNSANIVMNLSISFGGSFFRRQNDQYLVTVGTAEKNLLSMIHGMLHVDQSAAPASTGQSGTGMIPGFFSGKYAMLIGIGAWARQQLVENAPADFRWGVLPPLKAETQNTGISTQTLSIPKKSRHRAAAMRFIEFMLSARNMARLAQSDWMIPARQSCLLLPQFQETQQGWDIVTGSTKFLTTGPWLGAPGYVEWKNRVANPVLQEFFADRLSLAETAQRIEAESNLVLSRYRKRDEAW